MSKKHRATVSGLPSDVMNLLPKYLHGRRFTKAGADQLQALRLVNKETCRAVMRFRLRHPGTALCGIPRWPAVPRRVYRLETAHGRRLGSTRELMAEEWSNINAMRRRLHIRADGHADDVQAVLRWLVRMLERYLSSVPHFYNGAFWVLNWSDPRLTHPERARHMVAMCLLKFYASATLLYSRKRSAGLFVPGIDLYTLARGIVLHYALVFPGLAIKHPPALPRVG